MNDVYPSRGNCRSGFLNRKDPVVYHSNVNCPIDSDLIRQYEQQGFLLLENVFTADRMEKLQAEMQRLRQSSELEEVEEAITEPDSGELRSLFKVHELSSVFAELMRDKYLVNLVRYLLNDDVYIHQSCLNYKPGFRGKEFYWHSDFETWHVEDGMPRMRAISISIPLKQSFYSNGPLMFISGSHQKYVVCEGHTPAEHYKRSLKKQEYGVPSDWCLQELASGSEVVSVPVKPGGMVIFDCNIMHGSSSNITPYPRSSLFFVYNAVSNKVVQPFGSRPPRPEYICTRSNIDPIKEVD